jgi:hypothetical protein
MESDTAKLSDGCSMMISATETDAAAVTESARERPELTDIESDTDRTAGT